MNDSEVLRSLGASGNVLDELEKYVTNRFQMSNDIPDVVKKEEFISSWEKLVLDVKKTGIQQTLNDSISHGEKDIILKNPSDTKIEIYNSIAGPIPIIYTSCVEDFEELVIKLIHKGKPFPGIEKTGAAFAHGKVVRFIILSNKPYSNIPASKLALDDEKWKEMSMIIRRDHECAHYFTKRFLNNSSMNIHDELMADFAGIYSADGTYHSRWFLVGMGLDEYPKVKEGRFSVYTNILSEKAKDVLKKLTIKISNNIEKWSKTPEAKALSYKEKILFICKNNLIKWYKLY
ncbi:MAG: hypothetical protein LBF33_02855 [Oscillospiraceae bacterium]|nr:hypothetical protein [Oscillospiraceae bacterium]